MRFADINVEWRVTDIENKLRSKADDYEVSSVRSKLDRLEHSCRELSAIIDGLRDELSAYQNKVEELERNQNYP